MTTTAGKYAKVVSFPSRKSVGVGIGVRKHMSITRVAKPVVQLNPPIPIPDAKGSLSNAKLRRLAKKRQPPSSWYEGEEEQLF